MNIWSRGVLGPFWLAGRAKGGPGAFPDEGAGAKSSFFCEKSDKILSKAVENLPTIDENLVSGRHWTILGGRWRQGRFKYRSGVPLCDVFGGKVGRRGGFLEIPNIENGTKTARWRQDRHRDPLKTVPGSGFEKT